ncbi:MAG TPA: hypothetical protein VFE78_06610 [Gemmataceae bacterium]|jgi:hypothetical protein|nr:hypothetical protein [Gemmataceae bacterium]
MDDALQAHLRALAAEVGATKIPAERKHTAAWCLGQLPAVYALFRQTNESRHADEITRLLMGVVKELAGGAKSCPKAQELAAGIPGRTQLLHEQLGLPRLALKAPAAPTPRSRKAC